MSSSPKGWKAAATQDCLTLGYWRCRCGLRAGWKAQFQRQGPRRVELLISDTRDRVFMNSPRAHLLLVLPTILVKCTTSPEVYTLQQTTVRNNNQINGIYHDVETKRLDRPWRSPPTTPHHPPPSRCTESPPHVFSPAPHSPQASRSTRPSATTPASVPRPGCPP